MTLTLDLTNLITIGTFLVVAFATATFALLKIIAAQQEKLMAERFETIAAAIAKVGGELRAEAQATRQLETQFLNFKAELPRDYVRRDDFLREVGSIGTRIDNFALRMERALNQGAAS